MVNGTQGIIPTVLFVVTLGFLKYPGLTCQFRHLLAGLRIKSTTEGARSLPMFYHTRSEQGTPHGVEQRHVACLRCFQVGVASGGMHMLYSTSLAQRPPAAVTCRRKRFTWWPTPTTHPFHLLPCFEENQKSTKNAQPDGHHIAVHHTKRSKLHARRQDLKKTLRGSGWGREGPGGNKQLSTQ